LGARGIRCTLHVDPLNVIHGIKANERSGLSDLQNWIMVQKRIVELVDDLDGGVADETVTFGVDGKLYELDLSSANADALRAIFAPFISAGRRSRAGVRVATGGGAEVDTAAVRQWALENGHAVNTRGRIPAPILAAYSAR
jgi:hypothetical protein